MSHLTKGAVWPKSENENKKIQIHQHGQKSVVGGTEIFVTCKSFQTTPSYKSDPCSFSAEKMEVSQKGWSGPNQKIKIKKIKFINVVKNLSWGF